MDGYINCELCGINDAVPFYQKDDLQVVSCRRCGFIYVNPQPMAARLEEHYSENYFESWIRSSRIDISRRFNKRLDEIGNLKKKGCLLDIGCGIGVFLKVAQDAGWTVCGVEFSRVAAEYACREFDLKVFPGELQKSQFPDKHFDVITLWHTLEHSRSPMALLKIVFNLLKDDGILAIEVPNISSSIFPCLKEKWELFSPKEHLYHFSPLTLESLLNNAGFKVVKRQTYFWTSPDMVILKLLGVKGKSGIVNKLIRGLVYPLSIIRFKRLPGWINGDVMIVYAVKNIGATS